MREQFIIRADSRLTAIPWRQPTGSESLPRVVFLADRVPVPSGRRKAHKGLCGQVNVSLLAGPGGPVAASDQFAAFSLLVASYSDLYQDRA